jgi:hypothetical protein
MSTGDTSDDRYDKLVKPLSELSVHEVGIVLEAMKLGKYKGTLLKNEIDGRCLMECNTSEDVINMGITIFVKARVFLNEVMIWKASGVPMEYFSVNRDPPYLDAIDAEDTITVIKEVDIHDIRESNDDDDDVVSVVAAVAIVDPDVIQNEVDSNDNESEVDDTSVPSNL